MELQIVYLPPGELTPYEKNARKHAPADIDAIKKSILEDGFNDPIGIWGEENTIVEGHGRQLAAMELGLDSVPCIRLDHLTDKQRREYMIRHNRTAELSEWDFKTLEEECAQLSIEGQDFPELNFSFDFEDPTEENTGGDGFYTDAVNLPQYEPTGECPDISELTDTEKYDELCDKIYEANLDDDIRDFLLNAAARHIGFNYKVIANFYAHQPKEIQELMEDSALVLIDLKDAIRNGYAELSEKLDEIEELDDAEE